METFGQKHLVKCRCVLPQFKNSLTPQQHQFLVFSEIKDDVVKQKFVQCNNCGIIHKVTDICTSEIMQGKEGMSSIVSIEDIKISLHPNLVSILERNNCDLPTWEHAQYVIENKSWGDIIILATDVEGDVKSIKYVRILGEGMFKIDSHSRKDVLGD
jgi:hypothetical protein